MFFFSIQCWQCWFYNTLQVFLSCLGKGKNWTGICIGSLIWKEGFERLSRDHQSDSFCDITQTYISILTWHPHGYHTDCLPWGQAFSPGWHCPWKSQWCIRTILCRLLYPSLLFILKNTQSCSSSSKHQPSQIFWFIPQCPKQWQLHKTSADAHKLLLFRNRNETKINELITHTTY